MIKLTHPQVTASGRLKRTWEEIFPLSTWRSSQSPTGSPTEALTVHFNCPGRTGGWTSALRRALRACWRQRPSGVDEQSVRCTCVSRWAASPRPDAPTSQSARRLGPRLCPPIKEVSPLSIIYWETSVSSVHMREWGKKRGHCFQRVWGNKQNILS